MSLPHGYTIAQGTPAHAPLLAAIEIAAAGIFPPGSIPEHIRSDSVPESILLEAAQEGLLWVALAGNGRPVGYALVHLIEDAALLAQMDVHPNHMRKGIGSALISHIAGHLEQINFKILQISKLSFRRKCDFRLNPRHFAAAAAFASAEHFQSENALRCRKKPALYLTTFRHVPWNAPFYAKLGFKALNKGEEPLFLNKILDEEKRSGLPNRIAMRLTIP